MYSIIHLAYNSSLSFQRCYGFCNWQLHPRWCCWSLWRSQSWLSKYMWSPELSISNNFCWWSIRNNRAITVCSNSLTYHSFISCQPGQMYFFVNKSKRDIGIIVQHKGGRFGARAIAQFDLGQCFCVQRTLALDKIDRESGSSAL